MLLAACCSYRWLFWRNSNGIATVYRLFYAHPGVDRTKVLSMGWLRIRDVCECRCWSCTWSVVLYVYYCTCLVAENELIDFADRNVGEIANDYEYIGVCQLRLSHAFSYLWWYIFENRSFVLFLNAVYKLVTKTWIWSIRCLITNSYSSLCIQS